jgi:hypothetical protein
VRETPPERVEKRAVKMLDVVELRAASGRWPAGRIGTVVEDLGDKLIVEISDSKGRGLDFLELPRMAVAPIEAPDRNQLTLS